MLRRTIPLVIQAAPVLRSKILRHPFSTSCIRPSDPSDPLPSLLEDVRSPLDVTTVLRSGEGFKIRTLEEPTPFTINGNLLILDGQYFLWRPKLYSPGPNVLDIAPESWGILDVITPKPEIVVLGTGEKIMFVQRAREALAKMGMQLDIQDTKNAASMFNLLQAEGRSVAAALIVQQTIDKLKK